MKAKRKIFLTGCLIPTVVVVISTIVSCEDEQIHSKRDTIPPKSKPVQPKQDPVSKNPQVESKENLKSKITEKDTKIKSSVNVQNIGWTNLTAYQIYAQYQDSIELKNFIRDNLNKFIEGSTKLITSVDSFEAEFVNKSQLNPVSVEIKLTIKPNYWYKDNKVKKEELSQNVLINNLKPIENKLNVASGVIDNHLQVSKYKELATMLNLKYRTKITTLSDDYFSNILKNMPDYKNLTLTIDDGNTKENKLILKLNGNFKGQQINNEKIEITGFYHVHINAKNFVLYQLNINQQNWFDDLRPINISYNKQSINTISSKDWVDKYLSSFIIQCENNDGTFTIFNKEDLLYLGWQLSLKANVNSNSKIDFSSGNGSKLTYNYKKYNSSIKKWYDEETNQTINIRPVSSTMEFLKENDLKQYLVNQTTAIESKLNNHYPSYFLGIKNFNRKINNQFIDTTDFFENKKTDMIKNNYLKNKTISFTYDLDTIRADDFKNTLSLNVNLVLDGKFEQMFKKSFQFKDVNKKLKENELVKESNINVIVAAADSTILKNIIKYLKANYKNDIDNLFDNETNNSLMIQQQSKSWFIPKTVDRSSFFSYENNEKDVQQSWAQLEKQVQPGLFNKQLDLNYQSSLNFSGSNKLNFSSGLYYLSNEDIFYIAYIGYVFDNLITMNIINNTSNSNILTIEIDFKTKVGFSGNVEKIYNSKLRMTLFKSKWNGN